MLKLIDRNRSIPYGFKFKLPEAKWEAPPQSSFNSIVNGAMAVAAGNPHIAKQSQWPTTREGWENKIDYYNAALCKAHGWTGFYTETGGVVEGSGGPIPNSRSPLQFAERAAAGVSVLAEMFGKDGPIKDKALANKRAETCLACPKHDKGDWTRWFTKPAQAVIVKTLGMVKDLDLHTERESELQICTACACPMKGKVWARLDHILKHIPAQDKAALWENCWILKESKPGVTLVVTDQTQYAIKPMTGEVEVVFHVREKDEPDPAT